MELISLGYEFQSIVIISNRDKLSRFEYLHKTLECEFFTKKIDFPFSE